jgi:hypothetical protein
MSESLNSDATLVAIAMCKSVLRNDIKPGTEGSVEMLKDMEALVGTGWDSEYAGMVFLRVLLIYRDLAMLMPEEATADLDYLRQTILAGEA